MRAHRTRTSLAALALATLLWSPAERVSADTLEQANEIGGQVFDVLILRTGGVILTVVGGVMLIGAYPLSLIGESIELATLDDPPPFGKGRSADAVEFLVSEPFDYTFQRELGDF